MPPKKLNLVSREEAARRLKADEAAQEAERERQARAGCSCTAPGPDLRSEACADCGKFGPWGDGEFFYCEDHVPSRLRYLGKTREDQARNDK